MVTTMLYQKSLILKDLSHRLYFKRDYFPRKQGANLLKLLLLLSLKQNKNTQHRYYLSFGRIILTSCLMMTRARESQFVSMFVPYI